MIPRLFALLAFASIVSAAGNPYLVEDLDPTMHGVSSDPSFLATIGSRTYFTARTGETGSLWYTEGTESTTVQVPGTNTFNAFAAPVGTLGSRLLYVTAATASQFPLKITDGTAAGSRTIAHFTSLPSAGVELDGKLYFAAATGPAGSELWRTDGSTVTVLDLAPGPASTMPRDLHVLDGALYFYAENGSGGPGLYRSDFTLNTSIITGGTLSRIAKHRDRLLLVRNTSATKREYLLSDGTTSGTAKLIESDTGTIIASNESEIFFTGNRLANGLELWSTDGTVAGTRLRAIIPSSSGETVRDGAFAGSSLFFRTEQALYVFNGTAVSQLKSGGVASGFALNGVYYFAAFSPEHGTELWRSDGTTGGTRLAFDLRPVRATEFRIRTTSSSVRMACCSARSTATRATSRGS